MFLILIIVKINVMGGQVLPDETTGRSGISVSAERRQEFLRTLRDGGESGRIAFSILSKLWETSALPLEGALSVRRLEVRLYFVLFFSLVYGGVRIKGILKILPPPPSRIC